MRKQQANFAIAASVMCILFFILINYITSPDHVWFIYPSFAVLHWPISVYFLSKGLSKPYSLVTSVLLITFLIVENQIHSPQYPWFLYAIYPIVWWPILMYAGKYAKTVAIAIIGSVFTIIYYGMLNVSLSPGYAWVIYPAYAVLWWPLSAYFGRRKNFWGFSIWASVLSIVFFIASNAISSADNIWAIYPIFVVLWWPLSMYYYRRRE